MAKYRKKPVEIDAVQFDGSEYNAGQLVGWIGDDAEYVRPGYDHPLRHDSEYDRSNGHPLETTRSFLVITTLEGDHRADVDDWIIQGVQGEFYPCKPDIFEQTYDPVESA